MMLAGRIGGLRYGVRFLFFRSRIACQPPALRATSFQGKEGESAFGTISTPQSLKEEMMRNCARQRFSRILPPFPRKEGRGDRETNDTAVSLFV